MIPYTTSTGWRNQSGVVGKVKFGVPQKAMICSFLDNFGFLSTCWYSEEISRALLRREDANALNVPQTRTKHRSKRHNAV